MSAVIHADEFVSGTRKAPPEAGPEIVAGASRPRVYGAAAFPPNSSSRTACGKSDCGASGAFDSSFTSASAGRLRPSRDIVRASMAAAIGVANEVPFHAAQPPNAIVGSLGLVVKPCATFVLSRVNVDCRFDPRAVVSTHGP